MARVTIYLPDELLDAVRDARMPVSAVCRRALETALAAGGIEVDVREQSDRTVVALPTPVGSDDWLLYRQGLAFGTRWAGRAHHREIEAVMVWSGVRWASFSLIPAEHSLPYAYCLERGMAAPADADEPFWFERNAFTMAMLEGIAALAASRSVPASAAPGSPAQ